MNLLKTRLLKLAGMLTAGALLCSAQNFYGVSVNAGTGRRAGIYAPSSDDVSDALSINPAGLTAIDAPTVDLSITGLFGRGSFSNASKQ